MKHCIEIVHSQVKHSDESVIDDSRLVYEQNMTTVLQQFMQAMLYHVTVLMALQLHQDELDEFGVAEH